MLIEYHSIDGYKEGNEVRKYMSDALGSSTQTAAITKASVKKDEVSSAELKYVQADAIAQGISSDISSTKAEINQQQSIIDNPPTIPVTESSKKGSSTTHKVDEKAVKAAENRLNQLEQDLGTFETDLVKAQQEASTVEQDMLSIQSEFEEANGKLATLSEAEEITDKLLDVYQGEDGFLNAQDEEANIDRLNELVETISGYGDIDGNGSNDGESYANAIDAFLNGDNGYHDTAQNREYESDYVARGEVPPWEQIGGSGLGIAQLGVASEIVGESNTIGNPEYVDVDVTGSGDTRSSIRDRVIESGNNAVSNDLDV